MHTFWIPIGDTLRKAYHKECQQIGEGSKCSPGENNDSQEPIITKKLDNRGSEQIHRIVTVINDAEIQKYTDLTELQ